MASPLALLREILDHDRAAMAAMKLEAPWYVPSDDILELHRKIEACLSASESRSATVDELIQELKARGLGCSLDNTGRLIEVRVWDWPNVIGRYLPSAVEPLAKMLSEAMYQVDWTRYPVKSPSDGTHPLRTRDAQSMNEPTPIEPERPAVSGAVTGYAPQPWSAEQPAAAGWWWAERLSGERLVVELLRDTGRAGKLLWVALSEDNHLPVDSAMFGGWRWAGPLPEPPEPSDAETGHIDRTGRPEAEQC